ncbi:amino acid ABC transporter permease [Paenibacillus arenosi]|uniref:Amino acid ABC transporter permease n=1 Tax=Paenibacillus arenosi TaxID=2774142 RepID=A0ABR9AZ04_9BACL|nr:amino acid ABC transporter permease [Paenibacillus arenosi]MBD8498156.1 amino acid ABC transporter permease [Paenibacillus arenosi]
MELLGLELLLQSMPQLVKGLIQTLMIACYSIIFSTIGGIVFGALQTIRLLWLNLLTRFYLELFRSIPILVWLFFVYFGLPLFFNVHLSSFACAVLVLSLWGITEIGEVARGAFQSIARGQSDAGRSIGLRTIQLYRYILFPQALRRMIPPSINVYTRIIKTTSLTVLIGVTEVVKAGQQIIERTGEAILIYGCLFFFYFLLCYPLSVLSRKLEKSII